MKKVKVNIMFLIGILVLSVSIGLVFASFVFNQVVNVEGNIGGVTINSKNYLIYAKTNTFDEDDSNYSKAEKLRNDTVAVIEGIGFNFTSTYNKTSDTTFQKNKVYYLKDGNNYVAQTVVIGDNTNISDYYEESRTYTGVKEIINSYDSSCNEIDITISTTNAKVFTFTAGGVAFTVTLGTITDGAIKSATVSVTISGTENTTKYKAVIGVDGTSMVIIDTDITKTENTGYTKIGINSENSKITCSATENKYLEGLPAGTNKYYLSQLGLQFTFTSEIAVYVRIHIQDAWTRTRKYSSNTKELYVMKDVVGGVSPFSVADEAWYYDNSTNYVYLKEMYVPEKDTDGSFKSSTYTFNVNEAYFYNSSKTSAFIDYIDVDVSFTIDIVQANRAKALWKVDPSVDFNFS